MSDETLTRDTVELDEAAGLTRRAVELPLQPRLRLLCHVDLSRLGAATQPDLLLGSGSWVTVGRNAPLFRAPGNLARPLDDPTISREQVRIRWHRGAFEVEPLSAARRPVSVVDLSHAAEPRPLLEPARLAPGACLAIGDRALIGLEVATPRDPDADRLGIVGECESVWALRDEIADVALFRRPVLISGPTGAGKELVARAVHAMSDRARGPFVTVNCAALPAQLVESMLFGHRRGAFTGAEVEARGSFAAADGGTLFLDELGELPLALQPKMLRVLQDGVVVPVGAHAGRAVDVRVVAATNRDLTAEVAAGRLRDDLYHRVTAHHLRVPALSHRPFDIPELLVHFLSELRRERPELHWLWQGGTTWRAVVPCTFLAALLRAPWPGNVRELLNVAEQTARMNLEPRGFRAPPLGPAEPAVVPLDQEPMAEDLVGFAASALGLAHKTIRKLLDPVELGGVAARARREAWPESQRSAVLRELAASTLYGRLEATGYNQSQLADSLGTSRTTVVKLMRELGLPRAADLTLEAIEAARERAGGDLTVAARLLRVPPAALQAQLARLAESGQAAGG